MRIIYYKHPIWEYFLERVKKDYACIPINEPHEKYKLRCMTLLSYMGYKSSLTSLLYNQDFNKEDCATLVVDCHNPTILNRIAENHNFNYPLFLWLWNPLTVAMKHYNISKTIENIKKLGYDIYTFDPHDSKKYSLGLKNQFGIDYGSKEVSYQSDVYFCGNNKGREKILDQIRLVFKRKGLNSKIIIPNSTSTIISFEENTNNMLHSKCILDVPQNGQYGLTLRPIEALLNNKKLITTNKDIVKYDFYKRSNIFILGMDDNKKLEEFIKSPFEIIPDEIKEKYTFDYWLKSWQ